MYVCMYEDDEVEEVEVSAGFHSRYFYSAAIFVTAFRAHDGTGMKTLGEHPFSCDAARTACQAFISAYCLLRSRHANSLLHSASSMYFHELFSVLADPFLSLEDISNLQK